MSGYRVYSDHDVHTLSFIRRARDLGFSVPQIRDLLALWRDQGRASADVKRIALEHVEALRAKMREIEAITGTLMHLAEPATATTGPTARSSGAWRNQAPNRPAPGARAFPRLDLGGLRPRLFARLVTRTRAEKKCPGRLGPGQNDPWRRGEARSVAGGRNGWVADTTAQGARRSSRAGKNHRLRSASRSVASGSRTRQIRFVPVDPDRPL
jgi:MerR family transcriptional regulator, copper efflux regulator